MIQKKGIIVVLQKILFASDFMCEKLKCNKTQRPITKRQKKDSLCNKRPEISKNRPNSEKLRNTWKLKGVCIISGWLRHFRCNIFLKSVHANIVISPVFSNCRRQEKIFLEFPNQSEYIYFHNSRCNLNTEGAIKAPSIIFKMKV